MQENDELKQVEKEFNTPSLSFIESYQKSNPKITRATKKKATRVSQSYESQMAQTKSSIDNSIALDLEFLKNSSQKLIRTYSIARKYILQNPENGAQKAYKKIRRIENSMPPAINWSTPEFNISVNFSNFSDGKYY